MNFEQLTPKLKPLRFTGVKTRTRYEYDGVRIKVLDSGNPKDPENEEDSDEEKPPPTTE